MDKNCYDQNCHQDFKDKKVYVATSKNLTDEYIIGIIPIVLGKGRPLFLGDNPTIKLHLEEYSVSEGITILRYTKR